MSQVVSRTAAILRALERHPEGRSVGEVAGDVGLPRSTVHRLLKSLEHEHLVVSVSEERGFRLGPGLMQLAASAAEWLTAHAHASIAELSRDLDETVDLAVRSGDSAYFVDQVGAANRLQAVSAVGLHFPLHCTANGKALLSQLSDEQIIELLGRDLPVLTPATVVDVDALLVEIGQVRQTGLAFDREEHHSGISAVGTALANPYGLSAALSIPVPTSRFVEREDELCEALLKGRARVEAALGP